MFAYKLGDWTLEFAREYRMVCDGVTAVAIEEDRGALALLSLADNGNLRIERTYYPMICEIDAKQRKASFLITDEMA